MTLAVTVKPWMLNPKATLHGGMMATMLDMAMGLLARCCGAGMNVSTVGLSVSYLRPAAASEELLVTARVDKAGRRILFLSGDISRPDGKTVATATASFVP